MNHLTAGAEQAVVQPELSHWLDEAADGLDLGTTSPADILPRFAEAGSFRVGVPAECGGAGGDITDAVALIAAVSEHSLAAGLVLWGHRTYIEYLLQSPNASLRQRLLPQLLDGTLGGSSGLSNAMKFLSGLEELQISARPADEGFVLNGKLHWVTNLPVSGFHVAAAVAHADSSGAFIASLSSEDKGVVRSSDLDLIALRSTNTAAVNLLDSPITSEQVMHPNAELWLPQVRPAFLGLQIGMSIGLARRALAEARRVAARRPILHQSIADLSEVLCAQEDALYLGLKRGSFQSDAAPLFRIRIELAEVVAEAMALELHAAGGAAYLTQAGRGFARRWREAAFIPVITPSLVQLKTALAAVQSAV
jgi:alkylation response protein AidB-like acyl-CoA dehydrogenase